MNTFNGIAKAKQAKELEIKVREELRKNGRIPAIRMYRMEKPCLLADAIKFVDALK